MTSKEVLEKLLNSPTVKMRQGSYLDVEIIKLIKQDLDKLEKLEKVIEILKRFHFKLNETRHNNTGFELWTDSLLEYEEITQEEYELLKGILEDD